MTQTEQDRAAAGVSAPSAVEPAPITARPVEPKGLVKGSLLGQLLRTTDHKVIGRMYLVTSFVFFALGGMMALLMRAELARPGMQFLSPEQYNQLFTMHGTIMLLLFATPLVFAFANLVPAASLRPDFETATAAWREHEQDDPLGRFENEGGRVLPPPDVPS